MNQFWQALQKKQSYSLIHKAANDLIRKKLIPDYAVKYVKDNIKNDAYNRQKDRVKSISCPLCGITLPSRFLMRQHIKIHGQAKDNEPFIADTKAYFY